MLPFFLSWDIIGMSELSKERQRRWQAIVERIRQEYHALPQSEKEWIATRLQELERVQSGLDSLFGKADGALACSACQGACCAKGHNHMVLPNLLAYLQQDTLPPTADFSLTCPWLGPQGCVHEVGHRPYNCITFLCDKLEERLESAEGEEFYRLDRELRQLYRSFTERYVGGGMVGLLLQVERLGDRPFLSLRSDSNDSAKSQELV